MSDQDHGKIRITSFGIWLVENNLVEEYIYSNIRHKNVLRERWKYARDKTLS